MWIRVLILGNFIFLTFFSFSQDWKSKLSDARKEYKSGNYKGALEKYEEAKQSAPQSIDFSSELGQAAYKAGEFDKAESYYGSGIDETKKKSLSPDVFHNLGNAQMRRKNFQGAIESYKEALRKNPNDSETRYNLSEAIRQNKQNQKNNPPQNPPPGNKPDKNQKEKEKDKPDKQDSNNSKGDLPDRTVDRMLDKLSKKEAETKRKINNQQKKEGVNTKSGKDW